MIQRALVIGASGLVGGAVVEAFEKSGWEVRGTAHIRADSGFDALDIRDAAAVRTLIDAVSPGVVVLAAAYAHVDGCESDPERAEAVNVDGARAVAEASAAAGAPLVLLSTDYVFDGAAGPYSEDARPSPISVYGQTKLRAEEAVLATSAVNLVVRTTAVFGWNRTSKNIAMTVWRTLGAGERLEMASDQMTTPTQAEYLGEATVRLVQLRHGGVVNVAGGDLLSRAELGRHLARSFALDPDLIVARTTAELGAAAARPLHGGLRTERLAELLGTDAPPISDAMKRLRRQWRSDTYVAPARETATGRGADLKREILSRVAEYYELVHAPVRDEPFRPGDSRLPYAGRVFGAEELVNLVDAGLDFWLTLGPWGAVFERRLRQHLGARDAVLVNSGSSANLTAVTAMTSKGVERLRPGDEVITPAVTFPTTLAPLLQNGLVPVLVDCEIGTYNADPALLEEAIGPRTRAMMLPHTLGLPFDLDAVTALCEKHGLALIEDCCDALGSLWRGKPVGTFGDLATISFYPAHHMTMGEGGAVIVNRSGLSRVVRSVRDWGRDCWCEPGESNTCGRRFGWQLGSLPDGYDHKYTYSRLGYNLKPTDLQAAVGCAQLDRLDSFTAARRRNFDRLHAGLESLQPQLILPRRDERADPAWFAFPITVGDGISRRALVHALEEAKIETRELFGGNAIRQPAFEDLPMRVPRPLVNSDRVSRDTFFVGIYPGLSDAMIDHMIVTFHRFFAS